MSARSGLVGKQFSWHQLGPSGVIFCVGRKNQNKKRIAKIKIRSAQNVGKVWISKKKILLAPFGPIWAYFLRGPKPGPKPGPSQSQVESPKIQKIKILKIQIRSAQNVGKVWISREKILLAPLGASGVIFCMDRKNTKKIIISAYVPWWANGSSSGMQMVTDCPTSGG